MRKSKIMKALAVFGMSAVTATSIIGFAACTDNESGHKHTYDGWLTTETEHWHECNVCEEEADRGNHVDANGDKRCDVCDYELDHTFATEWSKDSTGHWHAATCDHTTLTADFAAHVDADEDNECDVCHFVGLLADGYEALATKGGATQVLATTFFAQDKKIDTAFTGFGTKGWYALPSGSAATTTNYVKVSGGSAVHVTDSANNTGLVADFGGNLTNTVVEGYAEVNPSATGNDWSVITFYNGTNCDDANRVFALHTRDSSGTLGYSLSDKAPKAAESTNILAAGGTYQIYYKFDLNTGRVTMTVNGNAIVTDLDAGITSLSGYQIISSNKGARLVTMDNLITITRDGTLAEYKATAKLSVNEVTALVPETVQTGLAEAKTTAVNAIEAAADEAACDTAYNTYYGAVRTAYKNYVTGILNSDYEGKYTTAGKNAEQYTTAKNALTTVLEAADVKIENAVAAYDAFVEAVDKLHTDDELNVAFNVTISDGTNTLATLSEVLPTDEITEAQLNAAINLDTVNKKATYYTGSVNGTEVEFPLTLNAATTIYVVVEELALKNVDFQCVNMTAETWNSEKVLVDGAISVTASSSASVAVDASAKNIGITEDEASLKSAQRIKLGGAGSISARSIKLTVRAKAKITILAMSSSSGDANHRAVLLCDADFTTIDSSYNDINGDSQPQIITYNVDAAGTYYFASKSGGLNVYRIVIEYVD